MRKKGFVFFLLILFSCDNTQEINTLKLEILNTYCEIAYLSYENTYQKTKWLEEQIKVFIKNPSEQTHEAAKKAWIQAREVYGQTEVFRFYGSPIDNPQHNLEPHINAWPLDESYIDYVEGNDKSGIINDLSIVINEQILRSKNEQNGVEENVSLGYHAIEFLLWGQDLDIQGAGRRKYTDYTTAPNAERRKLYLQLCTNLLLDDLQKVIIQWKAQKTDNYRANFLKNTEESIANILTGLGSLSRAELAGERMRVGLVNHDQEDEQSCFSDNTHRDVLANIQGMMNVYEGSYGDFKGKGLFYLISTLDSQLATQMKINLEESLKLAQTIQPPFDKEISGKNPEGNQRIQRAIKALDTQTSTIEQIARLLNVSINTKGA
jgi:putative iron-regulated protein